MLGRRVTSPSHLATTNCLVVFTRCWRTPELTFRSLRRGKSGSFDVFKRGGKSGPRRGCIPALGTRHRRQKRGERCNQKVYRFALSTSWTTIRHCWAHSNVLSARRD